MLLNRVIPVLTIENNNLVKTVQFSKSKYIGDPLNAVRIFNEKEVDEIMLIDISATKNNREPNYELIESISGECLMPLSYGGGIRTLQQAKDIFALGVEKICLNNVALKDTLLISKLVNQFGSQSIIISIDIKRNIFKKPKIYSYLNKKKLEHDWINFIKNLSEIGVGEILLNSVDKDGLLKGPDNELVEMLSKEINLPIVSLGGIASLHDMKKLIKSGASAVAAGSFFCFYGPHKAVLLTYPTYEEIKSLFS